MLKEHDPVVLIKHLAAHELPESPAEDLPAGTFGYVVGVYSGGQYLDVEFFDKDGETIDVIGVRANQVRAATDEDQAHKISA